MLGPEQINFAPRPTPMFLEGATSIRVTEQLAKVIGLADNQIIRGVIEDRGGILKLVLNNRDFEWQASRKFKPGDKIDFRVETSNQGKVLQPLVSEDTKTSIQSALLGTANALESPRLMSLLFRPEQPSVLSQLFKPASLDALVSQALDDATGLKIQQLFFSTSGISPQMIRSALINSGLFSEYFISNQLPPKLDLKQLLRSLMRTGILQNTESISIEKAIDEIESRQLEGVQAQQNREISYQFVIPFYDSEPVEVHFERGAGNFEKGETDWVINLHTESMGLGEIWAKTTIKATSDIEMIIWTREENAAVAANQGRIELEKSFDRFQLNLTKFSVLHAERPAIDPSLTGPGQVLDVST